MENRNMPCFVPLLAVLIAPLLTGCNFQTSPEEPGTPKVNEPEEGAYLFAYFRSGPNKTDLQPYMHYSYSMDGYHWTPLNNNEPVYRNTNGESSIIRDIFLGRGADGKWRIVFTVGNNTYHMGYAESADLINWSATISKNVMQSAFPQNLNVWAPEFFYDEKNGDYIVHWSSALDLFSNVEGNFNNRIFYARTKDFVAFTPAAKLFDPGYPCIDSHIIQKDDAYFLFFKDELRARNGNKNIPMATRFASSASPAGPYANTSADVVTPNMTEGAEVFRLFKSNTYLMYTDYWGEGKWAVCESEDLTNWRVVPQSNYSMPYQARHGSFVKITMNELQALKNKFGE